MAKEGKKEGSNDPKEENKAEQKIEEGVERRIESSPDPKKAVNIIGDIAKPDPTDKTEVSEYFKRIDAKLDQLLNPKKESPKSDIPEPETMPKNEEKHIPWYEREFI